MAFTTSGQEMEWALFLSPGAHMGPCARNCSTTWLWSWCALSWTRLCKMSSGLVRVMLLLLLVHAIDIVLLSRWGDWIAKWVALLGSLPKGPGSNPGDAKVTGTMEFVNIYTSLRFILCWSLRVFVVFGLYCINWLIYGIVVNLGAGL